MRDLSDGMSSFQNPEEFVRWLGQLDSNRLYAQFLNAQARSYRENILSYLEQSPAWRKSERILDMGCGPGYFPRIFAEALQGKTYLGVDRDPTLAKLYKDLAEHSLKRGRNDSCIAEARKAAPKLGFKITDDRPLGVPRLTAEVKTHFTRYMVIASELLERFYSIRSDRGQILKDMMEWSAHDEAEVLKGGGRWLVLSSVSP